MILEEKRRQDVPWSNVALTRYQCFCTMSDKTDNVVEISFPRVLQSEDKEGKRKE